MATDDWHFSLGVTVVLIVSSLLLFGAIGSTVAAQAIDVTGEFEGTFEGYEAGQDSQSHVIQVEGEFEITGENAQDVVIIILPGPETVLDQSSVETFVEGEREISFERIDRANAVELRAEEIESGTSVRVNYQTVFVGGTDAEEVDGGEIEIGFETAGGTEGGETFVATADVSSSADNRIDSLQSDVDSLETWRVIGIAGGIFGVLMLVVAVVVYLRSTGEESEKPPDSDTSKDDSGGPPV